MDEKVENKGEGTPQADSTPQETTEKTTPVGAGEKKEPIESSDKIPYPRFQEVNERMKQAETKLKDFETKEAEKQFIEAQKKPEEGQADPYAGMSTEEKQQTDNFVEKFVMPKVAKQYAPFVQQVQRNRINSEIAEAEKFASQHGINFKEKLPEIVEYLSRPENKGRLHADEAVRNLYFDQITNSVKAKTTEEVQKEKDELMEKKKQANMSSSTVAPSSVMQSTEMARSKMSSGEKVQQDIKESMELGRKGEKNPKVKSTVGDNLYQY